MKIRRWIVAMCTVVIAVGFTGGVSSATPPKQKCNSGVGNNQEQPGPEANSPDCDPGNSAQKKDNGE